MKKQDNLIVVQARQTSKRLPNKVLKKNWLKNYLRDNFKKIKKM